MRFTWPAPHLQGAPARRPYRHGHRPPAGAILPGLSVTGVLSHYLQYPSGRRADSLPSLPCWGYRLNQGLHMASGIAAIPLLLATLRAVYPRLLAWQPMRSSC